MLVPLHKYNLNGDDSNSIINELTLNNILVENKECLNFFCSLFPNSFVTLTNSCSSSLELAIRILNIGPGDELIIPAFGYVAVANAVVIAGAKPIFADVSINDGNIDVDKIRELISIRTKAIIGIHYAGRPFNIKEILNICETNNLYLIEDAAQGIGSFFNEKPLGSFGAIGCISFDYMKNVTCGQGGLLVINNANLVQSAKVVINNGTDDFLMKEGLKDKFEWVGVGNNFKINPIGSHYLNFQLKKLHKITTERLKCWNLYYVLLGQLRSSGKLEYADIDSIHNGHIFFIVLGSEEERDDLRGFLRNKGIFAEPHYTSLALSKFGINFYNPSTPLLGSEILCTRLLRLPIWNGISIDEIKYVVNGIFDFYNLAPK